MIKSLPIIAMTAVLTLGCLTGEMEHTIYLDPDGSATWMVLEKEIRSDSDDWAEEEEKFLTDLRRNEHSIAEALAGMGAVRVRSRLLRAERPYWALTTAEFVAVDAMLKRYLQESDAEACVWIEHSVDETRLVIRYRTEEDDCDEPETDDNVNKMLDDEMRIFLTAGRFVDAVGFEISEDGAVATPVALSEDAVDSDGAVTLSLTWTTEN